jgi:hypothetical protein
MGDIKTVEQWRARYDVAAVRYVDELPATVAAFAPEQIHVLCGYNTDGDRNTVPGESQPGSPSSQISSI